MFSATVLSLLVAFAAASDVTDLTVDTFDAYVGKEPLAIIEFFAPWCGHVLLLLLTRSVKLLLQNTKLSLLN